MILDDCYISYVNLDHRKDRDGRMKTTLDKLGLKYIRQRGMLPKEYKGDPSKIQVMMNRTPGAVGCHFSQVAIMEAALQANLHAMVLEDDLVFCDDFKDRVKIFEEFVHDKPWDVFWLGATFHLSPVWHAPGHPQLPECDCKLGRDWDPTPNINIVRTYGCWSTYAYIVNKDSLQKILSLIDENVHKSMGIDWLFILLEPKLETYTFVPGCVKQYDDISDIGAGVTYFSGFEKLGPHWWKNKM